MHEQELTKSAVMRHDSPLKDRADADAHLMQSARMDGQRYDQYLEQNTQLLSLAAGTYGEKQPETLGTLLDGGEGGIEDGRETFFYYEKYRAIEWCRFILIVISWGLSMLEYDVEFMESDNELLKVITYMMFGTSVLLVVLTYFSQQTYLQWVVATKALPSRANLWNTDYWKEMLFEMALYMIFPYPWTINIRVEMFNNFQQRYVYYHLNDFFTLIMIFRVVTILKISLVLSEWAGSRTNRVCSLYACKYNFIFLIKILMQKNPLFWFSILYFFAVFLFAFALRVAERVLVRPDDECFQPFPENICTGTTEVQNFNYFFVAVWNIIITLPTIGYGDIYPRTIIGRIVITLTAIAGSFLISMLVSALSSILYPSPLEAKSMVVLQKLEMRQYIRETSGKLMGDIFIIKRNISKDRSREYEKQTQVTARKLKKSVQQQSLLTRIYRAIENNQGNQEILESEFKLARAYFSELKHMKLQMLRSTEETLRRLQEAEAAGEQDFTNLQNFNNDNGAPPPPPPHAEGGIEATPQVAQTHNGDSQDVTRDSKTHQALHADARAETDNHDNRQVLDGALDDRSLSKHREQVPWDAHGGDVLPEDQKRTSFVVRAGEDAGDAQNVHEEASPRADGEGLASDDQNLKDESAFVEEEQDECEVGFHEGHEGIGETCEQYVLSAHPECMSSHDRYVELLSQRQDHPTSNTKLVSPR